MKTFYTISLAVSKRKQIFQHNVYMCQKCRSSGLCVSEVTIIYRDILCNSANVWLMARASATTYWTLAK